MIREFNVEQFYHVVNQTIYYSQSYQKESLGQSLSHGSYTTAKFIKHYLASPFIPFLSLEMTHVQQCIEASLAERDDMLKILEHQPDRKKAFLSLIYSKIPTVSPPSRRNTFSIYGCKKVPLID